MAAKIDISTTAGPYLIGAIITTFLSGITTSQAFAYFRSAPSNDSKWLKKLVASLWIIDLFHSIISILTVYNWFVSQYGNYVALETAPWTYGIDPFLTGLVGSAVQAYFGYKLYLVSGRNLILPIIVGILSLIQFGFAFGATIEIVRIVYFVNFGVYQYGVIIWLGSAALADLVITISLVHYLSKNKVSEYEVTNSYIDKILRNLIATGGATTIVAIANALVFSLAPSKGFHAIPTLILLKLYFNSLMVSLNARTFLFPHYNTNVLVKLDLTSSINNLELNRSNSPTLRNNVLVSTEVFSSSIVAEKEDMELGYLSPNLNRNDERRGVKERDW